jgi:hypothetical protein
MARRARQELTEAELDEMLLAAGRIEDITPIPVPVEVVAADFNALSEAEQQQRQLLERQVEGAFYLAGLALQTLREQRLYRSTHDSFERYCRERFGHSRQRASFLIAAAQIYQRLSTIGYLVLPANERQLRPLKRLPAARQGEAWQEAVAAAGGKCPSGRLVERVVERLEAAESEPNPYHFGDACQIAVRGDPQLRGQHQCWAIVRQVQPGSCTVACWDGEYEIALKHLLPLNYSQSQCRQLERLAERLRGFQEGAISVEAAGYDILEKLGKLERPQLTALEEELLALLEREYGTVRGSRRRQKT